RPHLPHGEGHQRRGDQPRDPRGRGRRSEGDPRFLRRAARLRRLQPQRALVDRRHDLHPLRRRPHAQDPGVVRQRVGLLEPHPRPHRLRGAREEGGKKFIPRVDEGSREQPRDSRRCSDDPASSRGIKSIRMIRIRTLDDLTLPRGARVFYRVDYNVPLEGTRITDTTRIDETLPTIRRLREAGTVLILASHLGRPKGERKEKYSLKPVREQLAATLDTEVLWADDCLGVDTSSLKAGELLLLENLRFHAGEEKNDGDFAAGLRKLADYYINDAFGACHRAHASSDALPRLFPSENTAGGLLLERELEFLQKVTAAQDRPFVALLGGAKIAGKI